MKKILRNTTDKKQGINPATGQLTNGDAAFADWLISFTYAFALAR